MLTAVSWVSISCSVGLNPKIIFPCWYWFDCWKNLLVLLDLLRNYTTTFRFGAHRMKGILSMKSYHSGMLVFMNESLYLLYVVRDDAQKGVQAHQLRVKGQVREQMRENKKCKQRWQSMEIRWKAQNPFGLTRWVILVKCGLCEKEKKKPAFQDLLSQKKGRWWGVMMILHFVYSFPIPFWAGWKDEVFIPRGHFGFGGQLHSFCLEIGKERGWQMIWIDRKSHLQVVTRIIRTNASHWTPLSFTAAMTESTSRSRFLRFAFRVSDNRQGIFL